MNPTLNSKWFFIPILFIFLISLISCEETVIPVDDEFQNIDEAIASSDQVMSINSNLTDLDNSTNQLLNNLISGFFNKGNEALANGTGPDITISGESFPITITIDYGEGFSPRDGVVFKGLIQIVSTDYYQSPESTHTMTFDSFSINDMMLEGTRTTTNLGKEEGENYNRFNVVFEQGRITGEEIPVVEFQKELFRAQINETQWSLDMESTWWSESGTTELSSFESFVFDKTTPGIIAGIMQITFNESWTFYWNFETKSMSLNP